MDGRDGSWLDAGIDLLVRKYWDRSNVPKDRLSFAEARGA